MLPDQPLPPASCCFVCAATALPDSSTCISTCMKELYSVWLQTSGQAGGEVALHVILRGMGTGGVPDAHILRMHCVVF